MKVELQQVQYMPKELARGVLYVSEKFGTAAHLCPCGCGSKIRTPLGPTEWSLEVTSAGPSLWPSVGNWQRPCKSHYWIHEGEIKWAKQWTPKQIAAGRRREERRRRAHFEAVDRKRNGRLRRILRWFLPSGVSCNEPTPFEYP